MQCYALQDLLIFSIFNNFLQFLIYLQSLVCSLMHFLHARLWGLFSNSEFTGSESVRCRVEATVHIERKMKAAHSEYINGESLRKNNKVNLSFCHILIKQASFDCNKSLYYSQAFYGSITIKIYDDIINHCWNTPIIYQINMKSVT